MKKLLTLIFVLVMILSMASCEMLPEDMQATIDGIKDQISGIINPGSGEHVHNFVMDQIVDPTCTKDGYILYKCSCRETKEEVNAEALGHDMQFYSEIPAACDQYGSVTYKCTRCVKKESTTTQPIGHIWGELVEASRLIKCTRENCVGVKMAEGNGKYAETLAFSFGDEEKAALAAIHEEIAAILAAADGYNSDNHGYAEEGALYEAYEAAYAVYEQYSDLIFSAQGQYSIAMTLYYCDVKNADLEKQYNDMQTYYTELVSSFYSLSQPWYDSMFREFFFYGATEEEIAAFLFDSNAYADPIYGALKDRNDEIELEFNAITDPVGSDLVPILYAEMVQNNNEIAKLLGYDNYLEYAYENIYDRDYSYEDIDAFVDYVKKYIVPAYNTVNTKWDSISGYTDADIETYYGVVKYSFFENALPNELFNDYIDLMDMAFTSNPDKQISFSDNLNNLMSDGNLFRGTYAGAYVTFIRDGQIPIAYFGKGYDSALTVSHEFGHYMNDVYNLSEYSQSYDLLETHSQGQEMLFIYFIEDYIGTKAYELVETYQLLSTLSTIVASVQVDCFERAIYLDYYDGPNSEVIMADGTITADEYDLLYASISEELGIMKDYRMDEYWRYGMTISSPCYYISYAISGINAIQIYAEAQNDSFESAKDCYLKLFTYTDENPEMTLEEILEYAGLYSFIEEENYLNITKFLSRL